MVGVGIWASCVARSQITAFIVALAVCFVLILVGLGPLIIGLPPQLGAIAAHLGVLSHFDNMGRGVIDLRDVVYFLSLAGVFLVLAYGALMSRKLAPGGGAIRRTRLGVLLLTAVLIVVNLLGSYIVGRIDLTPGKAYTLNPASRQIVGGLDDIVTIKVFASKELPSEVALLKRDLEDLLSDLRAAGKGKIRVIERDPADDPVAKRDAETLGIQPVQFNVVGQAELQVKEGYFGLAVQYADGVEQIPFIQRTDDLEYRLAAAIRALTRTRKPAIGIMSQPDLTRQGLSFGALEDQLKKSYDVRSISFADTTQPAESLHTLILAGSPDSIPAPQLARLQAFFARGGSALVMAGGSQVSLQMPRATTRAPVWNQLLKPFGIQIRPDMVYDLAANQIVPMQSDAGQVLQPYPFWVRSRPVGGSVVSEGVGDVFLPWTSSLDTTGAKGAVTTLLVSSKAAGVADDDIDINPGRDFPPVELGTKILAAMSAPSRKDSSAAKGRVVVVGNGDFVSDRYASRATPNLVFALNAIDWLAQDEALIAIRSRDRRPPPLVFASAASREGVKYANVIFLPLVLATWGSIRLLARRRRAQQPYRARTAAAPEAA
jgi:ABC-2 type transport system permease protein